jgi:hypothetical protein
MLDNLLTLEALGVGLLVDLILIGIGYKLYRKYRPKIEEALEDGKLTLDEIKDIAEEVIDDVEDLKDLPSYSQMKKMKKADLIALAEERGLDVEGTKDDIAKRFFQ